MPCTLCLKDFTIAAASRAFLSTVICVTLIGSAHCLVSHAIFKGSIFGVWFPRIPKWIAQLHDLYNLELVVREVVPEDDGIDILAGLPSLVHLWLVIKQDPEETVVIPSTSNTAVAFPALKHLKFCCPKQLLALEAGALPRLQNLELRLTVAGWEEVIKWLEPAGIEHLPAGLKRIFLYCNRNLADKATLSTLKSVFHMHHPDVDLWLPSTN